MRVSHAIVGLLVTLALSTPAAAIGLPADLDDATARGGNPVQDAVRDVAGPAGGGSGPGGPGATPAVPTPGEMGGDSAWAPYVAAGVSASLLGAIVFLASGATRFSTPAQVLENKVRRSIYEYLKNRVGANLKQITDDLDLTTTNAIWHLRKLEDANLVRSRRFNGYKVFYPTEGGMAARRLSLSLTALVSQNAQQVFEYVVANPGTHQRQIARALGVNHGTVRWHLKKLRQADLLTESRQGKIAAYYPTEIGLTALESVHNHGTTPGENPASEAHASS